MRVGCCCLPLSAPQKQRRDIESKEASSGRKLVIYTSWFVVMHLDIPAQHGVTLSCALRLFLYSTDTVYSGTGLTGLDVVKSHRAGTDRSLIHKLEADKLSHRDAEAKKLKVAHSSPYIGSSQSASWRSRYWS